VTHPHPLARVARAALCCAPLLAVAGRILPALPPTKPLTGAASARAASPLPVLAPPIAAVLHPPAAATAEVGAADELRAFRGIELCASVELYNNELHSSKQQGDTMLALKAYVASVCFNGSICLRGRGMLQGFCIGVASKIDRVVTYVVMVVHVYCKHLFPMFHLFFRRML
jgi:hypothetical protein